MADILEGDEELQRRFARLTDGTAGVRMLGQFGLLAVQFAKEKVPRKTGNLGRTIRVASVDANNQSVTVLAGGSRDVGYAAHVEFGTQAHTIVPRRAKSLFFPSQQALTSRAGSRAKLHFRLSGSLTSGSMKRYGNLGFQHAKRVRHPGTRAQPFLLPGAQEAMRRVGFTDEIIKTWDRAA